MPAASKTFILDDLPTDTDALDFQPYVDTLVDIIKTGSTPLTIGVFGGWGSGKTSLMKMIRKGLLKRRKKYPVAWFDAWKYDKEETLWRAFLLSVLAALRTSITDDQSLGYLENLETSLYHAIDIEKIGGVTIDLAKMGGAIAKGAVQIGLSFIPGGAVLSEFVKKLQELGAESLTDDVTGAIQRERTKIHIEQVRFLEQFQGKFRTLVEENVIKKRRRLVVFVDDLDRCLPEKAVEVMEAIKLFVDAPGCVFVLGLDHKVIERGVEIRYKEFNKNVDGQSFNPIDGARYLEKIIQLPFQIPPVEQADMSDFVHGLTPDWPHKECPKVFSVGLGDNPRQIKRTVNVFLMLWKLAEKREKKLQGRIKPIRLAKVVAIQAVYPELYNLLKEEPRYLRDLEEYYRAEAQKENQQRSLDSMRELPIETISAVLAELEKRKKEKEESSQKEEITEKILPRVDLPPALASFVSRVAVRKILTLHPPEMPDANFAGLPPDELRLYFTLTRRAEAPQAAPAEPARRDFEPQMVRIPAGKFLMGSTQEQEALAIKDGLAKNLAEVEQPQHSVELSEYSIGKYPVTNREYQAFVREVKFRSPESWDNDQYPAEKGDHPVVNISWEDAAAYCKWLSEKTGKAYRLPTEAEWEKAARGTDGRIYPWGDKFTRKMANTEEALIGETTPVGQFSPKGDSPFGCVDMAGNVWEWCADWFRGREYQNRANGEVTDPCGTDSGNERVERGGSFYNERKHARCAYRRGYSPHYWDRHTGFRVALSPFSKSES